MFCNYNADTGTLLIGNKQGKLDKSTLLIGVSDKRDNEKTIGQHGEGYKIATVVLLREGLSLKIYNFGCNEVWTARKIKSRRYGVDIPSFDIQKVGSLLRPVENHDLVFEIKGITEEMYEEIVESNLFLQKEKGEIKGQKEVGFLLLAPKYKGKIYVNGLYVCDENRLSYGYDFAPSEIKLDRDRRTIASWGLQSATSDVIASTDDTELIKSSVDTFDGEFLHLRYAYGVQKAFDEMAEEFFKSNGDDAVVVTNDEERKEAIAYGATPCIVSHNMAECIKKSAIYQEKTEECGTKQKSLSEKLDDWFERTRQYLPQDLEEEGIDLIEKVANQLY